MNKDITCTCGRVIPAQPYSSINAVMIGASDGETYYEFSCKMCGQPFREKAKPVIYL